MSKKWLAVNWGKIFFVLLSAVAYVRVFNERISLHYELFVKAGEMLWQGLNPYGHEITTGGNLWFYSPSCGMFLFGPFALLPEKLGEFVFVWGSWLFFWWGLSRVLEILKSKNSSFYLYEQWIWAFVSIQMMAAIWATKIEILMVGIILLCLSLMMRAQKVTLAIVLLAIITSWKFLTLSTAGLVLVAFLLRKKQIKPALVFICTLVVMHFIPLLRYSMDELNVLYRAQAESLAWFIPQGVYTLDNFYNFLKSSLGIVLSDFGRNLLAGGVALWLVGLVAKKSLQKQKSEWVELLLFCGAAGAGFTTLFNPTGQNNALIQIAPLVVLAFWGAHRFEKPLRRICLGVILSVWLGLTFAYSDIMPRIVRELTVKPAFVFILLALILLYERTEKVRRG